STDSQPPKRDCALLRRQDNHDDVLFDSPNRFSAGTPTLNLCALSTRFAPREVSAPATSLQNYLSVYPQLACKRHRSHSKRITSRVQTAHFKSLYRKRSGPGASACSRNSRLPERFRYSPRTLRPHSVDWDSGTAVHRRTHTPSRTRSSIRAASSSASR